MKRTRTCNKLPDKSSMLHLFKKVEAEESAFKVTVQRIFKAALNISQLWKTQIPNLVSMKLKKIKQLERK